MSVRVLNFILLSAAYGLTFLLISWRLWKNINSGGDLYQQGSWLTNFGDGIVRRGASGEVFLALANATGTSVIAVLGVVQFAAFALVLGTLFLFAIRTRMSSRITLLLLSPMLVLFWFNDGYAPLRMEILGYLAFAPLFLGSGRGASNGQVVLSLSIFALAVAFFEVNAAFAVPLVLIFLILRGPERATMPIVATGLIAVSGTAFALIYLSVPTIDGMCARAVAASASPTVCEGLMPWMAKDFASVVQDGWHEFRNWAGPQRSLSAIVTIVLLGGTLVVLLGKFLYEPRVALYLSICVLSFAPLYVLGSDWGRWISAQVFSCLFVIMAFERNAQAQTLQAQIKPWLYGPMVLVHLTVGMFHMVPFALPGFVFTVLTAIRNAVT